MERGRQQPAEEKEDVCSYAHQQEERGEGERGALGEVRKREVCSHAHQQM